MNLVYSCFEVSRLKKLKISFRLVVNARLRIENMTSVAPMTSGSLNVPTQETVEPNYHIKNGPKKVGFGPKKRNEVSTFFLLCKVTTRTFFLKFGTWTDVQ